MTFGKLARSSRVNTFELTCERGRAGGRANKQSKARQSKAEQGRARQSKCKKCTGDVCAICSPNAGRAGGAAARPPAPASLRRGARFDARTASSCPLIDLCARHARIESRRAGRRESDYAPIGPATGPTGLPVASKAARRPKAAAMGAFLRASPRFAAPQRWGPFSAGHIRAARPPQPGRGAPLGPGPTSCPSGAQSVRCG